AQRIETRKYVERNRRIGVPTVVLWNRHEFSPRAGPIHAHALRVWAKMPPPGQAIAAVATGDVSLAHYEITLCKAFHIIADSINTADKLVADGHRHRERLLRRSGRARHVHVGPTDPSFQHAAAHVVV